MGRSYHLVFVEWQILFYRWYGRIPSVFSILRDVSVYFDFGAIDAINAHGSQQTHKHILSHLIPKNYFEVYEDSR